MRKKRLFWFVLGMAAALPLAAQNMAEQTSAEKAVFAPFVSRLQGELRTNLIRLSWVDSPDVRGPVYIYRSKLPFEGLNPFLGNRLAEIPYGVQSFVDEIETSGGLGNTLYYFAAASDEMGRMYDIPIAFSNTVGIQISTAGSGSTIFVPGYSAGIRATITSLETAVQGDRVIITFTVWPENTGVQNAVLYRSIQPIKETPDLLGAVIVRSGVSSPVTDYPVSGIPYYYAVITEEDLIRGTVEIIPGRNATLSPAQAPAVQSSRGDDSADRNIRAMPLPEISVQAAAPGMNTYVAVPPRMELSPEAAKALANLLARVPSVPALKKPRVFTRDMDPQAGGEEAALAMVVKSSFTAQNWEAARNELVKFLALPRSSAVEGRARFYLGQCYYFLRRPREGLFEFLAIQDRYPAEAIEWIKASLDMMKE